MPADADLPAPPAIDDIEAAAFDVTVRRFRDVVMPAMTVAVGAGSRGLTGRLDLVRGTVAALRELGADPFVVPAMGSHGGATADGQVHLLGELGLTEQGVGAEIAGQFLITAGDNPERIHSEAAFAMSQRSAAWALGAGLMPHPGDLAGDLGADQVATDLALYLRDAARAARQGLVTLREVLVLRWKFDERTCSIRLQLAFFHQLAIPYQPLGQGALGGGPERLCQTQKARGLHAL